MDAGLVVKKTSLKLTFIQSPSLLSENSGRVWYGADTVLERAYCVE